MLGNPAAQARACISCTAHVQGMPTTAGMHVSHKVGVTCTALQISLLQAQPIIAMPARATITTNRTLSLHSHVLLQACVCVLQAYAYNMMLRAPRLVLKLLFIVEKGNGPLACRLANHSSIKYAAAT
jgi:hypothetical protein